MNNKKLLLTGARGFIGKYFIDKYNDKYDIKKFSFLKDDINHLDCNGIEIIVHLSALVHQMGGATKDEYEKINVKQTLDLAIKAKLAGVKQFIFMSSVKVYGEETDLKYTEDTKCQPEDDYGVSKLKAEDELRKIEDENFKVSILRTPIVYGYGVKANIKSLIKLVDTIPILPFKDIENKRSMVYIGNLCHLIDLIIENTKSGIFLASDDKPLSTSTLIKLISKSLNKSILLIKIPLFEILVKTLKPSYYKRLYKSLEVDNTITKRKLNFENKYSVEKGILFMINGEDN